MYSNSCHFRCQVIFISRVRVFVSVCCFRFHASHIMSSCALHSHTCSSHASDHFLRCPFCILALLSPPVVISSFLSCVGFKHFRIGPSLSCGLGLLPVDRLSSFVPFGLRLILQRLTEGPRRPRLCCSPTPFQFGPKPTKNHSTIYSVRSRSRGRKPRSIWSLLAPPTYKMVSSPKIPDPKPP